MNKFFHKIKAWFKPKKPTIKLTPPKPIEPFNSQHYRKLIGKIARQAIAIQRKRRVKC